MLKIDTFMMFKYSQQMKERVLAFVGVGAGGGTTALSIETIMQKSTPILQYVGLVLGIALTLVMLVYWSRKAFKKTLI